MYKTGRKVLLPTASKKKKFHIVIKNETLFTVGKKFIKKLTWILYFIKGFAQEKQTSRNC